MIIDQIIKGKSKLGIDGKSHARSAAKAVSWRVVGTVDTIVISYFITGTWSFALSIGAVEVFTKIFLFYLHDRAWEYFRKS
jgi:uncharacterized membrane protein